MTENLNPDELLTAKQAANFLQVTTERLRYLRLQGRVKGVRIGYNETLYRLSDLRGVDTKRQKPGRKNIDSNSA